MVNQFRTPGTISVPYHVEDELLHTNANPTCVDLTCPCHDEEKAFFEAIMSIEWPDDLDSELRREEEKAFVAAVANLERLNLQESVREILHETERLVASVDAAHARFLSVLYH